MIMPIYYFIFLIVYFRREPHRWVVVKRRKRQQLNVFGSSMETQPLMLTSKQKETFSDYLATYPIMEQDIVDHLDAKNEKKGDSELLWFSYYVPLLMRHVEKFAYFFEVMYHFDCLVVAQNYLYQYRFICLGRNRRQRDGERGTIMGDPMVPPPADPSHDMIKWVIIWFDKIYFSSSCVSLDFSALVTAFTSSATDTN